MNEYYDENGCLQFRSEDEAPEFIRWVLLLMVLGVGVVANGIFLLALTALFGAREGDWASWYASIGSVIEGVIAYFVSLPSWYF